MHLATFLRSCGTLPFSLSLSLSLSLPLDKSSAPFILRGKYTTAEEALVKVSLSGEAFVRGGRGQ